VTHINNSTEKKRVLIVEDEESNYELLKAMLRKKQIDVVWAQNGREAVNIAGKHKFDLVLMDIKMPEMNGYEALRMLRKQGINLPVVAQTAYARLEDENKALEAGFDAYISKPIDRNKLEMIIDRFVH